MALKQLLSVRWSVAIAIAFLFALPIAFATGFLETDNITDWKYSTDYRSGWLNPDFNDSTWSSGDAPFGTSVHFNVNTSISFNQIYVRKTINFSDNTQGIIKARAENNFKCYVNGNLVSEMYDKIHPEKTWTFKCYNNYYEYDNKAYYYFGYDDINDFIYVDVSKYLKKGTNVIACEAWVDHDAYYYRYYYNKLKKYVDGRPYLDMDFFQMDKNDTFWTKDSSSWQMKNKILSFEQETFQCNSVRDGQKTSYRIISTDSYSGNLAWGSLAISDGSYFRWSSNTRTPWDRNYIDPIWPYDSSNLYLRTWLWSDLNKTESLQISDTKFPECYVNEKKVSFTNLSAPYWMYAAEINLNAGQNLISCKSPKAASNSFDMRIVEPNGMLSIVDVSADASEFHVDKPATFTVTLANTSHPETDIAITLEAWGKIDSQEIVTTTKSSSATITFTPKEEGDYDMLFTAKDLIDNDTATYTTKIMISLLAPAEPNFLGFYPTAGNSDETGKNAGGSKTLIIGLSAAVTGAVALAGAYLISGSSSGFSLKKMDASLSRASNAMNTLNSMSDAKAAANNDSFIGMLSQKYEEFKQKVAAIEEEKSAIEEERREYAKRKAEIEAKDAQFKVKEMLAAPLGTGESLKDKYNKINAFMNSKGIVSAGEEYEKFKKFNEDSEAGKMDLSDPSWHWSAARMIEQQKAEQAKNAAAISNPNYENELEKQNERNNARLYELAIQDAENSNFMKGYTSGKKFMGTLVQNIGRLINPGWWLGSEEQRKNLDSMYYGAGEGTLMIFEPYVYYKANKFATKTLEAEGYPFYKPTNMNTDITQTATNNTSLAQMQKEVIASRMSIYLDVTDTSPEPIKEHPYMRTAGNIVGSFVFGWALGKASSVLTGAKVPTYQTSLGNVNSEGTGSIITPKKQMGIYLRNTAEDYPLFKNMAKNLKEQGYTIEKDNAFLEIYNKGDCSAVTNPATGTIKYRDSTKLIDIFHEIKHLFQQPETPKSIPWYLNELEAMKYELKLSEMTGAFNSLETRALNILIKGTEKLLLDNGIKL